MTAPLPTPSKTAGPAAIPDGTYLTPPLQVAEWRAAIEADDKLTAAEKQMILETAFQLGNHETIIIKVELDNGRWTQSGAFDGGAFHVGSTATYAFPDAQTVVINEPCCGPTTFKVTRDGSGFTLEVSSKQNSEVDIITGHLIFESAPFQPAP